MKNLSFVVIVLLVLFSNCQRKRYVAKEDYGDFYQKFHQDSLFQMGRITFPLPGIRPEMMDEADTIYYWEKEDWQMHTLPAFDPEVYKMEKSLSDSMAVEDIYIEDSGFFIRREFRPIGGKWFLTYYVDSNL